MTLSRLGKSLSPTPPTRESEGRGIELLSPAKDLATAIEAINHGADAVYIGAAHFGARAAAGNSVDDIARLVDYAHPFGVRIYVTLNTILRDDELPETERLIWQLYRVGVDALIVQDMGILGLHLPPIPLHASTQMDNRTPEQVQFLARAGFQQVVLARELSVDEIAAIHATCKVPLEVFVHGALCVSYSGQCYVSQHCFGRSANRGECAQFCRLRFDLQDADGRTIERGKYLLSLKDLNQSDALEELLAAGVTSLKIEGRLKSAAYVKNVTAYYCQRLDAIFRQHPEYRHTSAGRSHLAFTPQLDKSFNRGFTHYFLHGRTAGIFSPHTPKSMGEAVGTVKEVRGGSFTVAGTASFANGDGLCYLDERGQLQGMRINRVENNRLFPQEMPRIKPRTPLFRNFDQAFERLLAKPSAERKINVNIHLSENNFGFTLMLTDESGVRIAQTHLHDKVEAHTPQRENLTAQLSKLGGTPFEADEVCIDTSREWFIPASEVAEWRRQAVEKLLAARRINLERPWAVMPKTVHAFSIPAEKMADGEAHSLNYLGNVFNAKAADFYRAHGVEDIRPAFEREAPHDAALMTCKHCLRFSLGCCTKNSHQKMPLREPLYLVSADGRRFRLAFDCKNCQMRIYAENN